MNFVVSTSDKINKFSTFLHHSQGYISLGGFIIIVKENSIGFFYLCNIMEKEKAIPYPLRTEDICDVVCEPTPDYGKPIVYQGTTITNAQKDYYTFSTKREKVDVLKWIVAQPEFTELQRFSTAENKIYTLYTNQYDEILKTGEIPNNQFFPTEGRNLL